MITITIRGTHSGKEIARMLRKIAMKAEIAVQEQSEMHGIKIKNEAGDRVGEIVHTAVSP